MKRSANFIRDAAFKQQPQAHQGVVATAIHACDARVRTEWCFHIEADPIKQRQNFREALRHHARAVKANAKSKIVHTLHRIE